MITERRKFVLGSETHRQFVGTLIVGSQPGCVVTIDPPRRSIDQNAIFHAMCGDIAKAKPEWNGLRMDAEDWKALLIVSHAVATKQDIGMRLVPDLEGHGLVQLRESSARMSKARATSLIEYVLAWCAGQGIQLQERE